MNVIETMGALYKYAKLLPEGKDKWLVELAANALEHTLLEVEGNKAQVMLHVLMEELGEEE